MSYDPSHRQRPPRQERWPQATPAEAWQAYQEDEARQDGVRAGADGQRSYWATATTTGNTTAWSAKSVKNLITAVLPGIG